jgi:hypothetical protein
MTQVDNYVGPYCLSAGPYLGWSILGPSLGLSFLTQERGDNQ